MKTMKTSKSTGLKPRAAGLSLLLVVCWLLITTSALAGPPPVITVQPTNQTVQLGGAATFNVDATSGTTLTYQWYFQSNAISGATGNAYTVTNSRTTNAGAYFAAVQNDVSTVNSSNAVLTVTGQIITVDTTSDVVDGATGSIDALLANKGADGKISLREAIIACNNTANGASGPYRINFNIPNSDANHVYYKNDNIAGSLSVVATTTMNDASIADFDPDYTGGAGAGFSWFRIRPATALPDITSPVIVDGYSMPGAQTNTAAGYGTLTSRLRIEIDGSSQAGGSYALRLASGAAGSTIRGVDIHKFAGGRDGVWLTSSGNLIAGNYIGMDVTGLVKDAVTQDAIVISDAANNVIGGTAAGDRNILSGLAGIGVRIGGALCTNNTVAGNYLGANVNGQALAGNLYGVFLSQLAGPAAGVPKNNMIGGTNAGSGNLIVGSVSYGIAVNSTTAPYIVSNSFLGNSIYSNGALGIDLGRNGVTLNDVGDADAGPNNYQNFPVLTSAQIVSGTQVTIIGSLNSASNSSFRVEFFSSTTQDTNGYGEGQNYLGFVNVTTDGSGNAAFSAALSASVAAGSYISATATRCDNTFTQFTDTSEFARNTNAVLQADVVTTLSGPAAASPFTNFNYTVTVSNQGPYAAGSMVVSATLDNNLTFLSASGGGTYLAGVVTWPALPSLASGATSNYTVSVRAPNKGKMTSVASSTSTPGDPDPSNNNGSANASTVQTTVTALKVGNTSTGASVATLNWSHTVSPGSSRILIVGVSIDVSNATVVAANFGGFLPLTPIGQTNNAQTKVAMYYLLNPPVGIYPVSITLNSAAGIVGGAVSLAGVDQMNPVETFAGNSANNGDPSLTIASSAGGVVVDTVAPKSPNQAQSAGTNQTVAWNQSASNYSGAGSTMPGDVSVSPSWTINGNSGWTMAAVALNPSIILADVTLTSTGPASVFATSNLTYTITVTNLGPDKATNMVVSDVLPAGAIFVSASSGGTNNAGVVTWPTLTNFVNGARTNYAVTIKVPASGTLTNIVYSTAVTADPDPSNNNGTATNAQVMTSITLVADVATSVTGPTNVSAAWNFNYAVTVTNAGPSPASNVIVTALLPPAVTFVGASDAGINNAGVVTWPVLARLASGAVTNFTVTVTAPPNGTLTNIVSSASDATDPVPSNNDGSASAARVVTIVFPPALLTGLRLPGGAFQVDLNTLPNATCTFQASTNLVDWITLVTTNSSSGHAVVIDQNTSIYPQRFYRAVLMK